MSTDHNATGSMLGYLYQCRYALLAALEEVKKNPAHELSIECFDDIAFESEGTPYELIQSKHRSSPSDLSDFSLDIWKTILIWAKRVEDDPQQSAQTRFIFLTTATARTGSAMEKLRHLESHRDIPAATKILLKVATESSNRATRESRNRFIDLDDNLRKLLVSNIWVFDRAPNIIDVREEIEAKFMSIPLSKVGMFTDHVEGWWFNRVISALTKKDDPNITLSSLLAKTAEIGEQFKADNLPLSPGIQDVTGDPISGNDPRVFVRQMRLVDVKDKHAASAVEDYYRAFTQRSEWARKDLLLDEEAKDYDFTLKDAFQREAEATEDESPVTDEESKRKIGRELFHWSRRHRQPLRNRHEQWLSAGSFQMLSDRKALGWHPDFEELLSEEVSDT